uniref:BTB domain-containing protein n=1 Tax=Timema shepardi TaxID=629360 RepID=A0A7R9G045_TIMSH|nr:unnamed protein product [Timema shepardi]
MEAFSRTPFDEAHEHNTAVAQGEVCRVGLKEDSSVSMRWKLVGPEMAFIRKIPAVSCCTTNPDNWAPPSGCGQLGAGTAGCQNAQLFWCPDILAPSSRAPGWPRLFGGAQMAAPSCPRPVPRTPLSHCNAQVMWRLVGLNTRGAARVNRTKGLGCTSVIAMAEEQQFCLRWNNFHANITSQFEALRDEEDFVDVTLACDGQRLKAHKVVLSACSPYFKELFKASLEQLINPIPTSNPCKHPILFLRDVEFSHLQSLVEFMYAGEVNVAQAQLSSFLHTAESLQIRGLTEAPQRHKHLYRHQAPSEPSSPTTSNQELSTPTCDRRVNPQRSKAGADDLDEEDEEEVLCLSPSLSPPPAKRACQDRGVREEGQEEEGSDHQTNSRQQTGLSYQHGILRHELEAYRDDPVEMLEPKLEIPDYASDGECKADNGGVTSSFLGLENSMDTNNSLSSLHVTYICGYFELMSHICTRNLDIECKRDHEGGHHGERVSCHEEKQV